MNDYTYRCSFCSVIKFNLKKYLCHLELYHQHSPDFVVNCGLEHCRKQYSSVASLRNHYYRCHKEIIVDVPTPVCDVTNENVRYDEAGITDNEIITDISFTQKSPLLSKSEFLEGFKTHLSLFVLKLQEKHILPQIVQQTVIKDIRIELWPNPKKTR